MSASLPAQRPVPPVAPELEDCCRSGCTPCVFDLYEEALERYQAALARYEAELAANPGSVALPAHTHD